ncbi:MAG: hypothetical protein CME62_14425 [Halobacteriovoraceae bacterium]|nr:hypothetical protein [Halobacteriovoraceae bacterium]|tara:strand:- start:9375 stop:10274 length:900 start_codon:yes stop_codon:yes gene_type:complete
MIEQYHNLASDYILSSNSDAIGIAILDFKKNSFEHFEMFEDLHHPNHEQGKVFFDLASVTKALVNGFSFIIQDVQDHELELLVNHRAGLPAWGILEKENWKEQILSYPIVESDTLYSDFSALRYMLEFEKKYHVNIYDVVKKHHHQNIVFWKDLTDQVTVQNGFYHAKPNIGKVHDPNAYNVEKFTSHAGLFGTIDALAETLLKFNQDFNLLDRFQKRSEKRFHLGFDTVENPQNTLAGAGCSDLTFGHLGFTGTSFWIDPKLSKGHIILTNATKFYWHDKHHLNIFRREFGASVWKNQ